MTSRVILILKNNALFFPNHPFGCIWDLRFMIETPFFNTFKCFEIKNYFSMIPLFMA